MPGTSPLARSSRWEGNVLVDIDDRNALKSGGAAQNGDGDDWLGAGQCWPHDVLDRVHSIISIPAESGQRRHVRNEGTHHRRRAIQTMLRCAYDMVSFCRLWGCTTAPSGAESAGTSEENSESEAVPARRATRRFSRVIYSMCQRANTGCPGGALGQSAKRIRTVMRRARCSVSSPRLS